MIGSHALLSYCPYELILKINRFPSLHVCIINYRPVSSENPSSDTTNDMAESILKLIMEKGLKNEVMYIMS